MSAPPIRRYVGVAELGDGRREVLAYLHEDPAGARRQLEAWFQAGSRPAGNVVPVLIDPNAGERLVAPGVGPVIGTAGPPVQVDAPALFDVGEPGEEDPFDFGEGDGQ